MALAGRPLVCWSVDAAARPVASTERRRRRPRRRPRRLPRGARAATSGGRTAGRPARRRCAPPSAAVDADAEVVLVHDAARPLAPPDVVARVLAALAAGAPAVVPVLPVVDTTVASTRRHRARTPCRARRCAGCRPRRASPHAPWSPRTRGWPRGSSSPTTPPWCEPPASPVTTVPGDERPSKITMPHDLALAELLAGRRGERDAAAGRHRHRRPPRRARPGLLARRPATGRARRAAPGTPTATSPRTPCRRAAVGRRPRRPRRRCSAPTTRAGPARRGGGRARARRARRCAAAGWRVGNAAVQVVGNAPGSARGGPRPSRCSRRRSAPRSASPPPPPTGSGSPAAARAWPRSRPRWSVEGRAGGGRP